MTAASPKGIIDEIKRQYQEQALEDPLVTWLQKHGNKIFWTVVAVFAVYYLRNVYLETQLSSRKESADTFAQVRIRFDDWDAALTAEKEEDRKLADQKKSALEESIKALADAKEPYRSLAPLYTSLVTLRSKGTLVAPSFDAAKSNSVDRLTEELESLAIARAGLDSADKRKESLALLDKLSQSGEFVNAAAATILADIAMTDEEKAHAKEIMKGVVAAHPELTKVLKESLDRLG